jgi:hypothetical protein
VLTAAVNRPQQPSRHVYSNWENSLNQKEVIEAVFSGGFDCSVVVESDLSRIAHSRYMALAWSDGTKLKIILDQGFGFLRTTVSARHNFSDTAASQAASLLRGTFNVEQAELSVPIYVVREGSV